MRKAKQQMPTKPENDSLKSIVEELEKEEAEVRGQLENAQKSIEQIDKEVESLQRQRRNVLDAGIETQGRYKQIQGQLVRLRPLAYPEATAPEDN